MSQSPSHRIHELQAIISALFKASTPDELENIVKIPLLQSDLSNEYFKIYRGQGTSVLEGGTTIISVDGRFSRSETNNFFVLELKTPSCWKIEDIADEFGSDYSDGSLSAHVPKDSYILFKRKEGELKFGFDEKSACLKTLIVDCEG